MKVSNKKNIETIGLYLILIIPIIMVITICYFMIIQKIDLIIIVQIALIITVVIFLNTLRYKEFENSGYVITIVEKHPLFAKSFRLPVLEFPANLLKDFYIKGNIIYLTLNDTNRGTENEHVLKFILNGFNDLQRHQILTSLSETIENS